MKKESSVIKRAALLAAALLVAALFTAGCSKQGSAGATAASAIDWGKTDFKGEGLNLLTWEMYADPLFVKPFEEKYNCTINATFFATGDDLLAKLKAGGGSSYDVISPSGDMAGYLVQYDMIAPVDVSHISGWNDIPDVFKLPDMVKGGKIHGVPYLWGPDYVIYDKNKFNEPIKSWKELWEPKFRGRISLHDDVSNIYMIGQILGLDKTNKQALYDMADADLKYAQGELSKLNSNVRKYWSDGGELEDLFVNGEVDLGVGWPSTLKALQDQGLNLDWAIPEEGCTGWFDRLMIVAGSKHEQLATLWIDWCTSAEGEALGSIATTFSVSNPSAARFMDEDQREVAMVDDMYNLFEYINFWSYVENREAYNDVWTAVKTTK
jgi:putative spermidine/putrescine transport system substrate-binding protein/spermidine/putrescine transport system substrate-binding protein